MAEVARSPVGARRVSTLLLLVCASVIATGLPLPFGLAALLFLVPAFVVAVKVLATRGPQPRVLVSMMIALIVLITGVNLLRAAFYPIQLEYQECVLTAITQDGRAACDDKMQSDLLRWGLGG